MLAPENLNNDKDILDDDDDDDYYFSGPDTQNPAVRRWQRIWLIK